MALHTLDGSTQKLNNLSKIAKSKPNTRNTSSNTPVFVSLNQPCSMATIPSERVSLLKSSSIRTSNHSRLPRNKLSNSRVNMVTRLKSSKFQNPASILFDSREVHRCIFPRHCDSIDLSLVRFLLDGTPNDTVSRTISLV